MRRRQSSKLNYGPMEDRRMLASVSGGRFDGFVDLNGFQVDESISVTEEGSQISFQLASGDTWSQSPTVPLSNQGVTGLGTDTLVIDRSVANSVQVIGNRDAPTVDVVFASDISDVHSNFFSIDTVTQLPGTAVNLDGQVRAKIVRLPEASNRFTDATLEGEVVEIRSAAPISFDFIEVGDGVIASDAGVSFNSGGGFGGSFFGPGGMIVTGQLTVESGRSIDISSSAISVRGRLNLIANDDIRISSSNGYIPDINGGISNLARLNFQAGGDVNISLRESWPAFSGPSNAANFALVGDNFAQNLSINWGRASLINASGMTLNIAGNADFRINSSYLATNATDEIHIDGAVFIEADPFVLPEGGNILLSEAVVSIAEAGDVRFGSLQVEDASVLTVHEDDSTLLLGASGNPDEVNATRQITIRSAADIEIERNALIESQGLLTLEAEGELVAQRGQNKTLKGQQLILKGATINLDQVDGATVNFNSPGDVTLLAPESFALQGSNTGRAVRVTAGERIASTPSATLDARWLEMRGQSIWLANQTASDRITVNGRANFFATDFVIVGLAGTVESKLMNFQTEFANIVGEGNLTLVGDNSAATALVSATENIFDAPSAKIEFLRFVEFTAQSVHVADQVDDVFKVCGHVNFNVTDFVSVDAEGTAAIGTWRVTSGSGNIIHADSRTC